VRTLKSKLENRLNDHFAVLKPSSVGAAIQRSAAHWPMYAAVTGSALAMATSAAAGSITYSGVVNATAHISSVGVPISASTSLSNAVKINLASGRYFDLSVKQHQSSGLLRQGSAILRSSGAGQVGFLISATNHKLDKVSFLDKISSNSPLPAWVREGGTVVFAHESIGQHGTNTASGFSKSQNQFGVFAFSTVGKGTEYGWIRLNFDIGLNGLVNQDVAVDYAYASLGTPITVGQAEAAAPEPATSGMMLLAAGAASVVALRRRKSAA